MKNDIAIKFTAIETYSKSCERYVFEGRMTKEYAKDLLSMVTDVATNKKTYSDSVQLKVEKQRSLMQLSLIENTNNVEFSMLVAACKSDVFSVHMKVSYATCVNVIEDVDPQQLDRANE